MTGKIEGLVAAAFTPFREDGTLNPGMIEPYARLLARNGVRGVFACGSTGESLSLEAKERMEIAEQWIAAAPAELKVIVHCGHNALSACRALAAHAERIGAFGISVMAPSYFRPPTLEDLVAFCVEVAAAAPALPFYYYHIPGMTGVNFPIRDFLEAAADRIPSLAGVKYTGEDLMDYGLAQAFQGERFDLLFGRDEALLCGLALGARGAVGSTYNFAAPLYTGLMEAFDRGDLKRARTRQRKAQEMIRALFRAGPSIHGAMKPLMKAAGIDCGPVRPPLAYPAPEEQAALLRALDRIGYAEFRSK